MHCRLLLLPGHHLHQLAHGNMFPESIFVFQCGVLRGEEEDAAVLGEADVA